MSHLEQPTLAKIVNLLVYLIHELVLEGSVASVAIIVIGGSGDHKLSPLSPGCRHGHCWDRRWWPLWSLLGLLGQVLTIAVIVVAGAGGHHRCCFVVGGHDCCQDAAGGKEKKNTYLLVDAFTGVAGKDGGGGHCGRRWGCWGWYQQRSSSSSLLLPLPPSS